MAERLTPGVYVEETGGGVRPIQGVGTSTAGFIGESPRGIPDRAQFVTGYADFERRFGGHRRGEAGFLAQAVQSFFAAGGRRAYVVRVLPADAEAGTSLVATARTDDAWGERRDVLQFLAQGNGAWADHIRIHIEESTSFTDRAFRVRVEWTEGGRSRTVERFDNLVMDPEQEDYAVRVINETSQYLRAVDRFEIDFLDADERESPPIPEQVAALRTIAPGASGYEVPLGARLQFAWSDGASQAGTDPDEPEEVEFDEAAVTAVGGTLDGDDGVLTIARLRNLLQGALSDDFRVTSDADGVQVEPAVASRAYLLLELQDAATNFDLTGIDTVTVTADDGGGTEIASVDVDVSGDGALTPAQLADALADAIDDADLDLEIEIEEAESSVTVVSEAATDGVALSATTNTGATPWTATAVAGAAGTLVDSQEGVEITVSELIRPGVDRAMRHLFGIVRAAGLDENSQANPDLRPEETDDEPLRLLGGDDGTGAVGLTQYRGEVTSAGRTGMHAFDTVDVNMLLMPGRNSPAFLSAAMAYCDANDVFLVADGVGSIDQEFEISADEVRQFVEGLPARSDNAAMFYPWVQVPDPVGVGTNPTRFVPPSGHVAGIFARTDVTRGVWKAPAGIEAVVSGAVDLQHTLVDGEQDLLNPIGLNCLRQFPSVGIVSWGSRTLSSDPEWRYVPVRRTALFLKESLRRGIRWAVFEPNDQELWDRIRINITAFMLGLFRQGAFQGATPEEAFLVQCDRSTNPQELVDQGIVTARVAFAPLKPAEFVVIEISQKSLLAA